MIDFNKCFCGEIIGDRATYCTYCRLKKGNDANKARRIEETWRGVEEMYESWDKDLCVLTDLMNIIQKAHHVSLYRMKQKTRSSEVVMARFHFYYFVEYLKEKIFWFTPSNSFVGKSLGQDHAMYYYGYWTVVRETETDKNFKITHERLLKKVNELVNSKKYLKMEVQKLNNTLAGMPVSKSEISLLVKKTVDVIGEQGGAMNLAVLVSAMEEYIKTLKGSPRWRELVLDELKAEEDFCLGAIIRKGEFGTKYDYSVCGSSRWEELDDIVKKKTQEKKSLEEKFRMISKGATIVDEETGEIYAPPTKKSTTSYSISLKK